MAFAMENEAAREGQEMIKKKCIKNKIDFTRKIQYWKPTQRQKKFVQQLLN